MNAELKNIYSIEADLQTFRPARSDCFSLQIRAIIGPRGQLSEESFDLEVCTPKWLLENCKDPVWGRHLIIVQEFNFNQISGMIAQYCERCSGISWEEVASKVSRIGKWEFEDYDEN